MTRKDPIMLGHQLPPLVLACILLVAALCPHTSCKRFGVFRGRGSGVGLGGKQGLKLAGAAAAGAIGGAAIGHGLSSKGRRKHGYDGYPSEEDTRYYYTENYHPNYKSGCSSAPALNTLTVLGAGLSILIWG